MSPAQQRGQDDAESRAYPPQVVRYVVRFDRGEYWLAHEELEELWQVDRRDFFKGMIQIAAGFLHAQRGNWRGASRLLRTGLDYVDDVGDTHEGFDVRAIRRRVGAALARVEELAGGAEGRFDPALVLSMRAVFAGDADSEALPGVELPYRVRRYDEGYRASRYDEG